MTTVYLLWHSSAPITAESPLGDDNSLLLGVYSNEGRARARIAEAVTQPGFCDYPDRFTVSPYELDKDEWRQGFVEYEH